MAIERNGRRVMWKKNGLYHLRICLGTFSWGGGEGEGD